MTEICTVCEGPFDLDAEGGAEGYIGILPVRFCPTCRAGILDFADQEQMPFSCPSCGYFEEGEGDEELEDSAGPGRVSADADRGGPGPDAAAADLHALIAENICIYDPRSESFVEPLYEDEPCEPRGDCACDNCFYGRDALVMAMLRVMGDG